MVGVLYYVRYTSKRALAHFNNSMRESARVIYRLVRETATRPHIETSNSNLRKRLRNVCTLYHVYLHEVLVTRNFVN